MMQMSEPKQDEWVNVCRLEDILANTGVCCLLGLEQVAIFRLGADARLYAIGNLDPFSRANVLSRGLLGDRAGRPKVASPMYKQSFCLETGVCLDDPSVRVSTYEVRVSAGQVALRRHATSPLRAGNVGLVGERQSR